MVNHKKHRSIIARKTRRRRSILTGVARVVQNSSETDKQVHGTRNVAAGILRDGPRHTLLRVVIFAICAAAQWPVALGACKLKALEFPITMVNMQPLTTANVNARDVQFIVDSGAFFSMLSSASAAELNLKTRLAPFGVYVTGAGGGAASVSIATVRDFTLAVLQLHDVDFLVGGNDRSGSAGILGQNVLHLWDVEYDLGQGAVRMMKPTDCRKSLLAYWVKPADQLSVIDIESSPQEGYFQTMAFASVSGIKIRVLFDTGSGLSVLSLLAAARAGIKPDSPGVVPAGVSIGIGATFPTYMAPFSSFKIGDEEIKNTRLRIGAFDFRNADMLIGADFFLAHRIYVANGEHKLYFTYNGGPVFNLSGAKYPSAADEPHAPVTADQAASGVATSSPARATAGANTEDAGDFSRRGQALASRRDFDHALADLNRACELAPDNAEYVYQRGMVYLQMKQTALAMADFSLAIELKPDAVPALLIRAELKLRAHDKQAAGADLDAADTAMAKEENARLTLAEDYRRADLLEAAIKQFNLWIAYHSEDSRLPAALNGRCWARALRGVELDAALKDCNAALRHSTKASSFYAQVADSRGLVFLRLGDYDKSITDYDASLKVSEKNAWCLYGRGIDKLHEQKSAEGQSDLAQATAIWPQVADEFKRWGIVQ
jgi:tetratricopeptide (TPR) repeat protein